MSKAGTVLVVNERVEVRSAICCELEEAGFRVLEAADGLEGLRRFQEEAPDLVVSDVQLPGRDGIELLREIRSRSSVPVMLLTSRGDVPTVVRAIKEGAEEFLALPSELDRVAIRASELVGTATATADARWLEAHVAGESPAMRRVRERIAALAPLKVPVLVCGEPGTGRDCVVNALHRLSGQRRMPLISVRGGAGAAVRIPPPGNVVYLDEVDRLPPGEQTRCYEYVRAVEESGQPRRAARVYASTSGDLATLAREGSFHPKLADELLRFAIPIPPLRERIEDLDQIVPILVLRLGSAMGRERARVQGEAVEYLKSQPWTGNLREIATVLEKLVAFSPGGAVTCERVKQVLGEQPASVESMRSRRSRRQREELLALIESCGGNLAEVARQLNISRGAVIYRAQKHGLMRRPG